MIIFLLLLGWLCSLNVSGLSDREFLAKYDEVIDQLACEAAAQTQGSEMKVNLTRYSTLEEMTRLAFWSLGNDFTKSKLEFGEDIVWKRNIVHTLFKIFTVSCPTEYVPHGYMNVFREFAMIYLNSAEPRGTEEPRTSAWKSFQKLLSFCLEGLTPYQFASQGFKITEIQGSKSLKIFPPSEKVDELFDAEIDLIVDNLWWVFSHAMGRCFPKIPLRAIAAPKLKAIFVIDFLKPLMNRWGDPGPLQDFTPLIGNFDLRTIQRNLRYCVTAGYLVNGISDLQMVRPLRVGSIRGGTNKDHIQNRKTGDFIS